MTKTKHGETYKIRIITEVDLRAEDLADIACSAIEAKWGWFRWPKNAKGRYINEAMLEDGYLDILVDDPNRSDFAAMEKRVYLMDMATAFRYYMENWKVKSWEHYEQIQDGCTDDCILQIATFGEVIYG